jgi:hypothetical protein
MAKRRENMLEAFKASADEALAQQQAAEVQARSAGGPFAEAPAPPPPPPTRPPEPGPARAEPADIAPVAPAALMFPVGSVSFLAMQVVLLLGAFFLGRFSMGTVGAAAADNSTAAAGGEFEVPEINNGTSSNLTQPIAHTPKPGGAQNRTPEDGAFLDPENRFTIRTISYGSSPMEKDLAFKAYDHMRAEGLPVVTPLGTGDTLMIFVGAAPTRAAIEPLLKTVRTTPGPGNDRTAFRSAYIVNIEDYRR